MSLDYPYDPDNIFAKIIRGDIPSTKIYEDENTLAIMDAFPQSDGHCLVMHKSAPATNLLEINAQSFAEVMASVHHVAKGVRKGLLPDGIKIVQFNGENAGQTVFHLHVHIIPTYTKQSLAPHADGDGSAVSKRENLAKRIIAAI